MTSLSSGRPATTVGAPATDSLPAGRNGVHVALILNPTDGSTIQEVPAAGREEVDAAYERAIAAAEQWRKVPAAERGRRLQAAASILRERLEEFAALESLNTGRPLHNTRGESSRAAAALEYYAGFADKALGTTVPVGDGYHTYTIREPRGVILGIIPWNAPYVFAALKIAPALAFGNALILKPAEETPLTALLLSEVIREAGIPDDVLQIVTGAAETGRLLVDDARADAIAFTGHHVTGMRIAESAARHLTPVSLELGGKSPQLIFADADLDAALEAVLLGVFGQTGQMCIAGSRVFVEASVFERFRAQLVEAVEGLRVGSPADTATQVGPHTTRAQFEKTLRMIEVGRSEGATVAAQADLSPELMSSGGFYAPPTVFTDVSPGMAVMQEEIFGPVVCLAPFDDEADALRQAHATKFGLAAGVWTSDIGRAHRLARDLKVGTVWINTYRVLSVGVPFGGVGWSGYGREGGEAAVDLYTQVKSVWTAMEPGMPPGYRL